MFEVSDGLLDGDEGRKKVEDVRVI